jgi:hypothetical protein
MSTRIVFQVNGRPRPHPINGRNGYAASVFNAAQIGVLDGVQRVDEEGDQVVVYGQGPNLVAAVVNALEAEGVQFHNLRTDQADLEDVFLALTGREIENLGNTKN